MKKIFRAATIIAAAAGIALSGCGKNEVPDITDGSNNNNSNNGQEQPAQQIPMSLKANAPQTRASVGDYDDLASVYPVNWDSTDALTVFELTDDITREVVKVKAVVNEQSIDGSYAEFDTELTKDNGGEKFQYFAIYPYNNNFTASSAGSYLYLNLNIPEVQHPSQNSKVDPAAILMFAESDIHTVQGGDGELDFVFRHLAAYAKITLKGLNANSIGLINSVKLQATKSTDDNTNIAGIYRHLISGSNNTTPQASDTVEIIYDTPLTVNDDGTAEIWVALFPNSLEEFVVSVVSADEREFVKQCAVKAGAAPLTFTAGNILGFNVDMSTAEEIDYSGTYVVMVQDQNGNYYALSGNDASNGSVSRLESKPIENYDGSEDMFIPDNKLLIWTITKNKGANTYKFRNNGNGRYLSTSGNQNASTGAKAADLSIDRNARTNTFTVTDEQSATYLCRYANGSSAWFDFYTSAGNGRTATLYFIKTVYDDTLPDISVEQPEPVSAEGGIFELPVSTKNADDIEVNITYDEGSGTGWLSCEAKTAEKITFSVAENTAAASRTATVTVTVYNSGGASDEASFTLTQNGSSVTPEGTAYVLITSLEDLTDGEYIITQTASGTTYAMDNTVLNKSQADVVPITVGNENSITTDLTNIVWSIRKIKDSYVIHNGEYYLSVPEDYTNLDMIKSSDNGNDVDKYALWTIGSGSNKFNIQNNGSDTRYLRLSSNNSKFQAGTSSSNSLQLFKKSE